MDQEQIKSKIENAQTALGIELGSTRIKAVLVTNDFQTIASGDYVWENELDHHIWTYPMEKVWEGIQTSYAKMATEVNEKYGLTLTKIGAIGISAIWNPGMNTPTVELKRIIANTPSHGTVFLTQTIPA